MCQDFSEDNILVVLGQQMKKCCKNQNVKLSIDFAGGGKVCLNWDDGINTHSECLGFYELNMTHKGYNAAIKRATEVMKTNAGD